MIFNKLKWSFFKLIQKKRSFTYRTKKFCIVFFAWIKVKIIVVFNKYKSKDNKDFDVFIIKEKNKIISLKVIKLQVQIY